MGFYIYSVHYDKMKRFKITLEGLLNTVQHRVDMHLETTSLKVIGF